MPIGNQPPITNRSAAEKNKAAGQIHAQEMFKAGGANLPKDASTLQKVGAAFTQEQGQADVQATQAEAASTVADTERDFASSQLDRAEQNLRNQEALDQDILAQKTRLIEMGIGITEDDFADDLQIQRLEQNQTFANENELADLAQLTFENDEDVAEITQMAEQDVQRKLADDQWEKEVYDQALQDESIRNQILSDNKKATQVKLAKEYAEKKTKEAADKTAESAVATGVVTAAAGATAMYFSGGTVGGAQVAQGTQQVAQNA